MIGPGREKGQRAAVEGTDRRAQRAFFSQLAHDAGHHVAWVRMDPDRNMAASAAAHHGDLARLQAGPENFPAGGESFRGRGRDS